jgi:hypothetical protein
VAPLDFEIPGEPEPTFRVEPSEVGYVELMLNKPIRTRYNGSIRAFCLRKPEAMALARALLSAAERA